MALGGAGLRGDLRGRALLVILGCLLCQLGLGYGYVLGPLARDIITELEWTRTQFSGARAPQLFVMAIVSPLVGFLTIRFGARRILMVSAALIGAAFFAFSRIDSLWQMYAVVALAGVALVGLGDITVGQLVTDWVGRRRGLALGIVYTGSNLAGWLLVPIAVDIASRESWRVAISNMGIGAFLVILPAAALLLHDRPRRPVELPAAGPGADDDGRSGAADDLDLRAALRTRSFWILTATLFSFFFYFLGMLEHLVLFLTDEGVDREQATYYFSTAIGLGLVSKIALGAIADHIPERWSIVANYGLLALSSLILLGLPDSGLIWVFIASYGFATAARDVVYPMIINRCFGERYMAKIYGALMLALMPGGALGPLYGAIVHDRTGSYDLAFRTYAAMNVLAVVGLLFVRVERARTP